MKITETKAQIMCGLQEYDMYSLIAEAGRTCYKSKASDANANIKLIRNLIAHGHESVLEHGVVSVVIQCDRGVTHELVRHRIASYSQESTRYCNYSQDKHGGEISYIDIAPGIKIEGKLSWKEAQSVIVEWWSACEDAERHYLRMLELGATPQIARSVLNCSTRTEICVTMNIREWRHFFTLRCAETAHPQMRELANLLLEQFQEEWPVLFDDIPRGEKTNV